MTKHKTKEVNLSRKNEKAAAKNLTVDGGETTDTVKGQFFTVGKLFLFFFFAFALMVSMSNVFSMSGIAEQMKPTLAKRMETLSTAAAPLRIHCSMTWKKRKEKECKMPRQTAVVS